MRRSSDRTRREMRPGVEALTKVLPSGLSGGDAMGYGFIIGAELANPEIGSVLAAAHATYHFLEPDHGGDADWPRPEFRTELSAPSVGMCRDFWW